MKALRIISPILLLCTVCVAQRDFMVTGNGAGRIRLGMTIAQARRAMPGYKFRRVTDGEGSALIEVRQGRRDLMSIYAGEEDGSRPINPRAKIEQIRVWDRRYHTAKGIHPMMSIAAAEKILGKVERLFVSEIESREYAEFRRKPKGMLFRVNTPSTGRSFTAGIYAKNSREATRYVASAFIEGIEVSHYFD